MNKPQQLKPAGDLAKLNTVQFPNESDDYRRARNLVAHEPCRSAKNKTAPGGCNPPGTGGNP